MTAVNGGGESFPSEIAGARTPVDGVVVSVLVVNGFDRFDSGLGRTEDLSNWALGNVLRLFTERMNDGSYSRRHGFALAQNGVPFDSASAAAVASGSVDLPAHALVDWYAGRALLPTAAIEKLRAHVEAGGKLLLSGSHLATALSSGDSTQQQFLSQVLCTLNGTAAGTQSVEGVAGGALEGLSGILLDDRLRGAYPAGVPDVLTTGFGAPIAQFTGTAQVSAVRAEGAGQVVFLSFPFEEVRSEEQRVAIVAIMQRLLSALAVSIDPVPYDGGSGEPESLDTGVEPDGGTPVNDHGPIVLEPIAGRFAIAQGGGCGCASGGTDTVTMALLGLIVAVSRRRRR